MPAFTPTLKNIIYHRSHGMAKLCLQVEQQYKILEKIRAVLPVQLASHALHCVIKKNKLVIYTDSASWASQLRFYAMAIQGSITPTPDESVVVVQVKVLQPPDYPKTKKRRNALIPSPAAVNKIRHQGNLTTDPSLKKSLLKLSNTLEKLNKTKY